MGKATLRDLLTAGASVLEGVAAHRIARDGMRLGPVASQVVGVGLPAVASILSGVPIKPTLLGAAVGSIGSGVADAMSARPSTFLAWGDSHGDQRIHREVVRRMAQEPGVDFGVFLGDAVDDPSEWRRKWDNVVKPLRDRWPIYRIQGNHDDEDGYERRLNHSMPMVIRMERGAVYLVNDDEDIEELGNHAAAVGKPIIACMHRGPLAWTAEGLGNAAAVGRRLAPLLARADVVICGDQHVFGRGEIAGAQIVTAGIAGPKHYRCLRDAPGVLACDPAVRGYLRVQVGDRVNVRLVEVPDGDVSVPQG